MHLEISRCTVARKTGGSAQSCPPINADVKVREETRSRKASKGKPSWKTIVEQALRRSFFILRLTPTISASSFSAEFISFLQRKFESLSGRLKVYHHLQNLGITHSPETVDHFSGTPFMISFRRRVIEPFLVACDYAHKSARPQTSHPGSLYRFTPRVNLRGKFPIHVFHFLSCRAVIHHSAGFIAQAAP